MTHLTNTGTWAQINAFMNAMREVETDDPITTPAALVVVAGAWHQTSPLTLVRADASQAASAKVPHNDAGQMEGLDRAVLT